MRNIVCCFFLIVLVASCKKNDKPVMGENRLVKVTVVGGTGSYKSEFEYDASGRFVKQSSSNNGAAPVAMTQLVYTGNDVAISYPNDPIAAQRNTKFQLDAQGRPVKRIYTELDNFGTAVEPEKHFDSETTDYEYDASGYLTRYTGIRKDSLSYYPTTGVLQTSMDVFTYSAVYEITGGNLKSVKKTSQRNYTASWLGGSYNLQQTIEETTVFSYDKNYPNHFDFKNAFLFNEIGTLPVTGYSPNESFLNYPNKAVITKITKNAAGAVTSTSVDTEEPNLTFDTNGYLLTLIFNPTTKLVFTYNRF